LIGDMVATVLALRGVAIPHFLLGILLSSCSRPACACCRPATSRLAVTVLFANLLADLTYGVLDPRVRHGAGVNA
jgi:ABC-type dipeptide/oligopeptide/nickel transport system permease component